ncbi:Cyclin-dependent kinase G1 [Sesamum alatum]|uniref:Cyclin-dependent kinase G1 n=1 Tax=Sesamum alatum TaxID=300844 RepID=A0AAE2CI25_9LAMI|nr:Cyclin-dependent kinase G1 [Sesamum alatum]
MKHEFYGLCKSTLREIHVPKSLPRHHSIVEFKEVVVDACDRVFVMMEHLDNDFKRLMDVKMLSMHPGEVKCMIKQLLEGFKFLQENGVLHRDLKPSNLLVNKNGELKICDFGAPEVLASAKAYSSTIDMWSVGYIMVGMMLKEVLLKGFVKLSNFA